MIFMIAGYVSLITFLIVNRLEIEYAWIFLIVAAFMFITQLINNKFAVHAVRETGGKDEGK